MTRPGTKTNAPRNTGSTLSPAVSRRLQGRPDPRGLLCGLTLACGLALPAAPARAEEAPVQEAPAPQVQIAEEAQLRALLGCIGDAAIKGAGEEALRGQIAFLCALARAPVTASCDRNAYLLAQSRRLCARRDRVFWSNALSRAFATAGRPDDAGPRLAELSAKCDGVAPGPADPVGCLTNAIWRDWASVASGAFLDLLKAQQQAKDQADTQ